MDLCSQLRGPSCPVTRLKWVLFTEATWRPWEGAALVREVNESAGSGRISSEEGWGRVRGRRARETALSDVGNFLRRWN